MEAPYTTEWPDKVWIPKEPPKEGDASYSWADWDNGEDDWRWHYFAEDYRTPFDKWPAAEYTRSDIAAAALDAAVTAEREACLALICSFSHRHIGVEAAELMQEAVNLIRARSATPTKDGEGRG